MRALLAFSSASPATYVLGSLDFQSGDLDAERTGGLVNLADLKDMNGISNIDQNRQPPETGQDLAQQLDPLVGTVDVLEGQTGHVSARARQTCDETSADRIPRHREDDRDDRCRLLDRDHLWGSIGDNHIDLKPDEFGGDLR